MADAAFQQDGFVQPIAEAAAEVVYFEKSMILRQPSDVVLGRAFSAHSAAGSFGKVRTSATVRNFLLRDVVLDADTLLLLKDGKVIPETSYFLPEDVQNAVRVRHDALLRVVDTKDVIVACNRVHNHYHHWMTQCLPAIDWSLRQARSENVLLLLPRLEPWQDDTLALLGHAAVPRLVPEPGAQYLIPNAEYSEFLNGSTSFRLSRCLVATARQLADAVTPGLPAHRVIYVPCTNPYYGRIENEQELTDLLREQGVHILDRSAMTTAQRVALFRHADVVIGPHGEGLSDVMFCKPGSVLWELTPRHLQNACYNRLAQAAGLDYWGDLCESIPDDRNGGWRVDPGMLADRLSAISRLPVSMTSRSPATLPATDTTRSMPLDELMLEFESLGDNCEFGLIQRTVGIEPLGLLRFAGFFLTPEMRLEKLISSLIEGFEGLGAPETIELSTAGERREFVINETRYGLMYHTFKHEGDIDADKLRQSESRRLGFLRRKLFEDLASGEKIWVWKSNISPAQPQMLTLLRTLRDFGPNILLWVVEADTTHQPGTVECINEHLIKGYVERFAPYGRANEFIDVPWYEVCQKAYDLFRGNQQTDRVPEEQTQPSPSAAEMSAPHDTTEAPVLPEASLSESAAQVRDIEVSEQWVDASPTTLGQGFWDPRLQQDFRPVERTLDLRDHRLSQVFLDTIRMVLIRSDGHKIRETYYLMFPHEYDGASVRHDSVVWLDHHHDYVLGCNRGFGNYYHWMTQALPAIDWSLRNITSYNLKLALRKVGAWQEETLQLLGYNDVPRITLDESKHYFFPQVHYSDFLFGKTSFGVSVAANETYARLCDAALDGDSQPAEEVVYVARSDSAQRAMVNELEMIEALAREDVRIVVPGEHSVREQAGIFNRASMVIGAHGAGLTNIVFCRPGTIVYEFMPSFYTNSCYRRLAQAAGLTYCADIFDGGGDGFVHDISWRCDLSTILDRLRQFRRDGLPRPVTSIAAPP
jgi:capsular polysaccharide biosynthesis protein